jgi:hypothetical protein
MDRVIVMNMGRAVVSDTLVKPEVMSGCTTTTVTVPSPGLNWRVKILTRDGYESNFVLQRSS